MDTSPSDLPLYTRTDKVTLTVLSLLTLLLVSGYPLGLY